MSTQKPVIFEYDPEESFRDKVSTIDDTGKRSWIYAFKPQGKYYNARTWLSIFYLAIFFALPFIKVNGHPFFLFNILERKFILFGKIFWPQDFFLFGLAMITGIVFIIVFTVIFGRIFCGWACPQTVFMEMIFRKLEYWIEGTAAQQRTLDKSPWNARKFRIKLTKWTVFYALSFLIGNFFLAYIIGIDSLWTIVSDDPRQHLGGLASMMIFSSVFFFVFLWFREQVCTVVCPYGRLQGVLLDRNSIVVAYDYIRGEPRTKIKAEQLTTGGDCIDCNLCVKVCPTGIDIRNGTQLECTNCTACIDACDQIMEKVQKPSGLIRYASEANIADNKPFMWTNRIKAYSVLMVVLIGILGSLLMTRKDLGITIIRVPGQLYQTKEDGRLSNLYNIKIINKTFKDMQVSLMSSQPGTEISLVGKTIIDVPGESLTQTTFFLIADESVLTSRKTSFQLEVYANGKKVDQIKTNFLGPVKSKS
jgi:cytochrome c oxidase accessory protein FixG